MILALLACAGDPTPEGSVSTGPAPLGEAACAVCGMVVAEQPSPRGQVVYRDGDPAHVCSIEELRALATMPSSKGRPQGVFVEVLPTEFDVGALDVTPLAWQSVQDAWFVFGAERRGVMGEPVLSFASEADALRHAQALESVPVRWSALEQTPFHLVPASSRPAE